MSAARDALDRLVKDNPEASKDEIKELFIAAIMDDLELMRVIAIEVRQEMFIFDPNRAANVVALTLENDPAADDAFESLLHDMRPQ
jgi:hypothetical protein